MGADAEELKKELEEFKKPAVVINLTLIKKVRSFSSQTYTPANYDYRTNSWSEETKVDKGTSDDFGYRALVEEDLGYEVFQDMLFDEACWKLYIEAWQTLHSRTKLHLSDVPDIVKYIREQVWNDADNAIKATLYEKVKRHVCKAFVKGFGEWFKEYIREDVGANHS